MEKHEAHLHEHTVHLRARPRVLELLLSLLLRWRLVLLLLGLLRLLGLLGSHRVIREEAEGGQFLFFVNNAKLG
jgi:hypothetical protein